MDRMTKIKRNLDSTPQIDPTAYVSPMAYLIGAVTVEAEASIWPFASLRGDIEEIHVGKGSNVQDGAVLHVEQNQGCHIGDYVTIGHKAIVHACTVEEECLIGMGAILLDGAHIGAGSIIGAGALVTKGTEIPPGSLVLGSPAKVVKPISEEARADLKPWAERYIALSREYLARQKGSFRKS